MKQLKYVFFMLTALMVGGCSTAKTVTTSEIDINSLFTDVSEQGVSEVTKVMPEPQTEQNDPTLEEAEECARLVGAKHNIPYHNTTDQSPTSPCHRRL